MPIIIDGEKWFRTDEFHFDKRTGKMIIKKKPKTVKDKKEASND